MGYDAVVVAFSRCVLNKNFDFFRRLGIQNYIFIHGLCDDLIGQEADPKNQLVIDRVVAPFVNKEPMGDRCGKNKQMKDFMGPQNLFNECGPINEVDDSSNGVKNSSES